jgi:hypothetical protein
MATQAQADVQAFNSDVQKILARIDARLNQWFVSEDERRNLMDARQFWMLRLESGEKYSTAVRLILEFNEEDNDENVLVRDLASIDNEVRQLNAESERFTDAPTAQ